MPKDEVCVMDNHFGLKCSSSAEPVFQSHSVDLGHLHQQSSSLEYRTWVLSWDMQVQLQALKLALVLVPFSSLVAELPSSFR